MIPTVDRRRSGGDWRGVRVPPSTLTHPHGVNQITMCDYENLCFELIDDSWVGVAVEFIVAAYSFVGIAVVADEHLTTSLETLCKRFEIPEDVAGASFLALGSAAPEIVVAAVSTAKSIIAARGGASDDSAFASSLGISSIIGSGMLAFTLIPGLCAVVVPRPMELKRRPLARDAIVYTVSLTILVLIVQKKHATMSDAIWMLAAYAAYILVTATAPWIRESYRQSVGMLARESSRWSSKSHLEENSNPMELGQSSRSLSEELSEQSTDALNAGDGAEEDDDEEPTPWYGIPFMPLTKLLSATCPACETGTEGEHLYPLTFVISLVWLAAFSTALSAAVTRWGTLLEVPGTTMGMYVIAVGAQIPDTLAAMAFAKRGYGSMAVASALGSQVINILIGLGEHAPRAQPPLVHAYGMARTA